MGPVMMSIVALAKGSYIPSKRSASESRTGNPPSVEKVAKGSYIP